jgi:4-hydroxy 2-oxovalerate aldolase
MIPQLLDVTLRDGGYVNEWQFSLPSAVRIVAALAQAGVPFIELGYYRPRLAENDPGTAGPKCCHGEYLRCITKVAGGARLVVMVHLPDVRLDDYTCLAEHGISLVRFILGTAGAPQLDRHIAAAHDAGLLCSVNLIRVSERSLASIIVKAREVESMGADWLYTADSNGGMLPEGVEEIYQVLSEKVRVPLGYHAHDNLRLALANSLAAVRGGARILDSSMGGMGKGAGNLVTELIASYLKRFLGFPFEVGALTTVTCEVLADWIDAKSHQQSCESALSALLNLNIDDHKEVLSAAAAANRSLLDQLEYSVNALAQQLPELRQGA